MKLKTFFEKFGQFPDAPDAADEIVSHVPTRELSKRDSRAVLAMLSRPRRPNAAMRKAARRYLELMTAIH